jgi:MFS family permease
MMGALGDRFGRRSTLHVGLVIIGSFSAWIALTNNATTNDVIAARALMGLGAACVMPATLSVVVTSFPKAERPRAIGIWAAAAGVGAPIGLFVGGWAVQYVDWQAVFLVNVPIAALCLGLSLAVVPESRDALRTPLDPVGGLLSLAGLGVMLYTIIEAPIHGWTSTWTLMGAASAVILLLLFGLWERQRDHPMLPMSFFREPGFVTGLLAVTLAYYVMFTFMFTQMLHFQLVRGDEALASAVRFLPLPLGLMPAAANSDRLVARYGRSKVVGSGLLLITFGMLLFGTVVEIGTDYWIIGTVFLVLGLGMGLTMAPSTGLVMESVPDDKAGVGSATNDSSREIGGALGIAVGGSLLNEYYQRSFEMPAGLDAGTLSDDPTTSFPAAVRMGNELLAQGQSIGSDLIVAANEAFVTGMTTSATASSIISFLAAMIVFRFMPGGKTRYGEEDE